METDKLLVLATRCHTASCCPTIMASQSGEEIIIIGDAADALVDNPAVRRKVGHGEAAVVISRELLPQAVKSLNL